MIFIHVYLLPSGFEIKNYLQVTLLLFLVLTAPRRVAKVVPASTNVSNIYRCSSGASHKCLLSVCWSVRTFFNCYNLHSMHKSQRTFMELCSGGAELQGLACRKSGVCFYHLFNLHTRMLLSWYLTAPSTTSTSLSVLSYKNLEPQDLCGGQKSRIPPNISVETTKSVL